MTQIINQVETDREKHLKALWQLASDLGLHDDADTIYRLTYRCTEPGHYTKFIALTDTEKQYYGLPV